MLEDFYTASQLARKLQVSRWTVTYWCRNGKFPNAQRLKKKWLVPACDLYDHGLLDIRVGGRAEIVPPKRR